MGRRVISALVVFALLAGPHTARAQTQKQVDETVLWHDMLQRLDAASFVSIRLKDGKRLEGTILQVAASEFVVKPRTRIPVDARSIAYQDVASIDVRKRPMSAGRKVVTGVAVGLGVYLLAAVLLVASAYD